MLRTTNLARHASVMLCALFVGCADEPTGPIEDDGPEAEAQADDASPQAEQVVAASPEVTEQLGVVEYLVLSDDAFLRVMAYDAQGELVASSQITILEDGLREITLHSRDEVVSLVQRDPYRDEAGALVIEGTIDGQAFRVREGEAGSEVEVQPRDITGIRALEAWSVLTVDLDDRVTRWRAWSCTQCIIQTAACTTASALCAGACTNPFTCGLCAAGVVSCWNSWYANCQGPICAGGGGGGGGGGGEGGCGSDCCNDADCDPWEFCIAGQCC